MINNIVSTCFCVHEISGAPDSYQILHLYDNTKDYFSYQNVLKQKT